MSDDLILDRVRSTFQTLKEKEAEEIQMVDMVYETTASGYLKEITLIVATGGPHIEINLVAEDIRGYWGGDQASYILSEHLDKDKEALETVRKLREREMERAEGTVIET